jgi:Ni,Fe-hydrogenase III large subunit
VTDPFELGLANRRAVPFARIPVEPVEAFRAAVVDAVHGGARIVTLFGMDDSDATRLVAILADDARGRLGATSARVEHRYPALTPDCKQAHRFECEIAEQCGVVPDGHPGLHPVRRHAPDHIPAGRHPEASDRETYPFGRFQGHDAHEVAVGPVHAGIIEPGHFRFQAHGEDVLSLDIMLGYQHRGVERLLEQHTRERAILVAESIAGDAVVGHSDAYCGALESLARCRKSPRAQAIRGLALELERLANHIGDLGAIAGDVAFAPAAAYFGRMRGECLNLLLEISGNRFGRGLSRPGGVAFDVDAAMAEEIGARVEQLRAEIEPVARLLFGNPSVQARLEGVGVVPRKSCDEWGFVGPVARACEVSRDVRLDHPWGIYRFVHVPVATAWAGDVFARSLVRWVEIQRSLEFVLEQSRALPKGPTMAACGAPAPHELAVALVEGWRGEIAHVVVTDERGAVRRYKVTDPSFHNWQALALAVPGNQMSDFPLCNKSFNLSYAGHDL